MRSTVDVEAVQQCGVWSDMNEYCRVCASSIMQFAICLVAADEDRADCSVYSMQRKRND